MADSAVSVTAGSGTSIDTRTEATNGNHRQVVVLGDPSTNAGVAPVDATTGLKVDLGTDNDVTITSGTITTVTTVGAVTSITNALPAGTNAIGKLSANSGVDIGDVDVTSLTGGTIAHDSADSGNPIKIGAKASATLSDDTMVANADRTDATSDLDGCLLIRPQFPLGDLISEAVSNTDGASTAFTNFGATASTRSYVTAIHAFRTDAGTTPIYVDFRDGTAGSVLYRMVLPPNGGAILPSGATPYFRTTANTALAYDVSAATTTVYISISGFKSKV